MINTNDIVTLKMHIDNANLLDHSIANIILYKVNYLTVNQRHDKMIAFYGADAAVGAMNEVFFYDPHDQSEPDRVLHVEKDSVSCRLKPAWLKPGKHLFYIKIIYESGTEALSSECVVDAI